MAEYLVPVDAQGVVISWLRATLPAVGAVGVSVDSFIPARGGSRFVRVVRTGGAEHSHVVDSAAFEVESYVKGTNDAAAFELAGQVRGALHGLDGEKWGGSFCYGVESVSGAANLPNPTVPGYQRVRQAFTVDLRMLVVS